MGCPLTAYNFVAKRFLSHTHPRNLSRGNCSEYLNNSRTYVIGLQPAPVTGLENRNIKNTAPATRLGLGQRKKLNSDATARIGRRLKTDLKLPLRHCGHGQFGMLAAAAVPVFKRRTKVAS